MARLMFYAHLWMGIIATGILVVVSVTGVFLNHKRGLGFMPTVEHEATAPFEQALPLSELARLAMAAAPDEAASAGIDRMDVRPDDGIIKVRFDDHSVIEVTLDIHTGEILHVGERNDVFLEKLHSGEAFGDLWILLSDTGAVFLLILIVSGYWLWLYPKSRI